MLDFAKIHLHELLAVAANKARSHMGELGPHPYFQDLLEAAARFSKAHYEGKPQRMFDAAQQVLNSADEFAGAVPEPVDVEPDWQAKESRAYQKAAL